MNYKIEKNTVQETLIIPLSAASYFADIDRRITAAIESWKKAAI